MAAHEKKAGRAQVKTRRESPNAGVPIGDVTRIRADDFKTFYVNNASLGAAYYDVSIVFSEIQAGPDDQPLIAEKCRVVMNPAHAKALVIALGTSVKRWEAQYGAIQLPAGMVAAESTKDDETGTKTRP